MENVLATLGFQFDPFLHLDASLDRRLHDYLVIPSNVNIAWSDDPAAIFALPGGGKSALRMYTEKIYRDSRGVKFAVTYIPGTYATQSDFHENALKQAVARAVLIFLFSYPEILNEFTQNEKNKITSILRYLPYNLPFLLSLVKTGGQIEQLEALLGVNALSGVKNFGEAHLLLVDNLLKASPDNKTPTVEVCFDLIKNLLGARSIHILLDGLDGFSETVDPVILIEWINPLLNKVDAWAEQGIYLKFFLPVESSVLAKDRQPLALRSEILTWDNDLLAALIRRRIYIASDGRFGSLDAFSAPGLRDVELQIAQGLSEKEKLPRQMILRTRAILMDAESNPEGLIQSKHLKKVGEGIHART